MWSLKIKWPQNTHTNNALGQDPGIMTIYSILTILQLQKRDNKWNYLRNAVLDAISFILQSECAEENMENLQYEAIKSESFLRKPIM